MRPYLLAAAMLLATAAPVAAQRDAWPTRTPRQLGLNPAVLDSIDAEIRAGAYGYVDRFLVIRHGAIAYDRSYAHDYATIYADSARVSNPLNSHDLTSPYNYFAPWWHPTYRGGTLHTLQSVTKTVTSVVIGVAVTRGDFPSIDTPILTWFDTTQVAHVDDRKRRVTVRHLLTMTGGFDWNEALPYVDPRNTAVGLEASPDWIRYTIDRPMMREPGTVWNYSSGESALLAYIFRQATGWDVEEYAARFLFAPLGITDWFWKRTPSGTADTEGGLYLEARDLARIFQLFVNGGMWRGERVVSEEWVGASTSTQVRIGERAGSPTYGYKWFLWPNPADAAAVVWAGSGFGGQLPMAFPERDMVVVFNGWNILPNLPRFPQRQMHERLTRSAADR